MSEVLSHILTDTTTKTIRPLTQQLNEAINQWCCDKLEWWWWFDIQICSALLQGSGITLLVSLIILKQTCLKFVFSENFFLS